MNHLPRCVQSIALGALLLQFASFASADDSSAWHVEQGKRELFLDDVGLDVLDGVSRKLHQPQRHPGNPLIRPDTAWEDRCQIYGTALYDEQDQKFKLWYLTTPRDRGLKPLVFPDHERPPHTTLAAYAESSDGVNWIKPKLGVFPYDGDSQNNLLDLGKYNCEGISVLHEPHDPDPEKRFKAVYWDHGSGDWEVREGKPFSHDGPQDGFCVAFSPDGVHWKAHAGNPVLKRYCDTNQNVVYDPRLKRYVAFSRFGMGRRLARSESADFLNWSEPQLVLECDAADGPGTQIYGAGVDLYEGLYLTMIWIYREGTDGTIDTQLAVSRDGLAWSRVANRQTWLSLGPVESWEGGMVRSVERIIKHGNQLYIYYCGVHGPHTGPNVKEVTRKHRTAIGLLHQRRDGFVSLHAGSDPGRVRTKPFVLPPGELRLNIDARGGRVVPKLFACAEDGSPAELIATGNPLEGDQLEAVVDWNSAEVRTFQGKRVCLELELSNADWFSYWWN